MTMAKITFSENLRSYGSSSFILTMHEGLTVDYVQSDRGRMEVGRGASVVAGVRLDHVLDGEGPDAGVAVGSLVAGNAPGGVDHQLVVVVPKMIQSQYDNLVRNSYNLARERSMSSLHLILCI